MMKKTFSYIWPLTKKISTSHSGILEVTWLDGKKILDSKNANYSYGSLEKVLDRGLAHSRAERSSNVLLLGLGGGSVLGLLREKYKFDGIITAVEIDPEIIEIAKSEFNISKYAPLELVCEDAYEFVKTKQTKYSLVIIDIFIDAVVPPKFFSSEFIYNISALLKTCGEVIFNTGINSANDEKAERILQETRSIKFKKLENVNGTNTLLVGIRKEGEPL